MRLPGRLATAGGDSHQCLPCSTLVPLDRYLHDKAEIALLGHLSRKTITIEVKPQMLRLALVFSPRQGVLMGKSCSGRVELSAFLTLSVCLCCGERVLTFTPFLGCWESLHLGKTLILGR